MYSNSFWNIINLFSL